MWNLLRLALYLTVRNTASTKMLAFWTQNLTWVGFDTASIKMLPFWTQNLTGVGFEPTHTFVYQKSQRRISWVWRRRPLGHPALSISHLLHPVFDNNLLVMRNPFVLLLIWLSELLLRPKCWLFERKIWQEWDSNPGTHSCTRSLKGEFLESGALDRSAILPWVYRTCFILSSITPSCNVKSAPSCSWFDCRRYCFDQNVGFLNAKFDRSGIRYCFD